MLAHEQLTSGTSLLDLKISNSNARPVVGHVLVLVHGLPRLVGMGRQAAGLLPELAGAARRSKCAKSGAMPKSLHAVQTTFAL